MRATHPNVYVAQFDERNHNPSTTKVARWILPGSRVLEVGCATGFLTQYLVEQLHCIVIGVEYNRAAALVASQWAPVHVLDIEQPGSLESCGSDFDVIVFGDVLEHLHDPQAILERVSGLLASSGRVLVSLPNVAHYSVRIALLRGRFDYTEGGLLDRTHLRLFTMHSARELFLRAGYRMSAWDITMSYTYLGRFIGPQGWLYNSLLALMKIWPNFFAYQFIFCLAPKR